MKKILIILGVISFIASCRSNNKSDSADSNKNKLAALKNGVTQPTPVSATLDAVDSATAVHMIDTFKKYKDQDQNAKAITVWLSKEQLYNIDTLLQSEAKTKGTNGIRLYFGCNPPPKETTKLDVSILMVSTRERISPPDPAGGGSPSIDYYAHVATFLNSGQLETPGQGDKTAGAELYYPTPCAKDICNGGGVHYIDCRNAHDFVHNRSGVNYPINTCSEWYNLCWIHSLFQAIYTNKGYHINGLRIYVGYGNNPQDTTKWRDFFVLAPTYDNKGTPTDFYECLEDFTNLCDSSKLFSNYSRSPKIKSGLKPFWMADYDKGELCPNTCN